MTILFIEDNPTVVEPAMHELGVRGISCKTVRFENFAAEVAEMPPDIVVIDMMNGGPSEDPEGGGGKAIYDQIWTNSFCPIIIYSANPDLCEVPKHPFICKVKKGGGTEANVLNAVLMYQPYLEQKERLRNHVCDILNMTLKETAPAIFMSQSPASSNETLLRVSRRRIAAEMDCGFASNTNLEPWEQYLFPAIGQNWLQGDVVKSKVAGAFFLVLTPSCDLVPRNNGKLKVKSILCASCSDFSEDKISCFLGVAKEESCEMCGQAACVARKADCDEKKKKNYKKQKISSFVSKLNMGCVGKYFLLPGVAGVLPDLLANFKDLSLIPAEKVNEYERIISIDSPFREQLSWSFISLAGRPGMPDRDFERWALEHVQDN